MLNSETKRKIQTLRDILVGKIPTPTGQVEQITLALIYKFMSDIDTENEKDFGKKTFFVDTGTDEDQQFAQYHWANIMKSTNTAQQRLELYAQGLEKMNKNPNLSETFRNIFKGAFLPYRDPAILNLFLKGVNEIEYTHSEELGNAFEFLLSVMAAQGDAGQFRTPRHIIDFIVQVVDPKKDDTILDPACGTAGFLISAYKHILAHNTDPKIGKPGSALTTKERQQLPHNITGYDVSHEMVRLSLANMFLHLFPNPQIFEYDSLSDDSRWNDEFSCVLANPPFMTPKGGIKPHKRFQIPANRAEVLFVDYIMEHLTTNGKAGIIVPEGIIFQTGTAYKALRKMMIEDNYLWAVVSLPSGVFQPYSGVKTSILFFDKELAKKSDSVYFVKIENDGYDLGAQRRPIEKNDLPGAFEALKNLKSEILEGKDREVQDQSIVIKATKEAIRKDGDYNLSGERYRTAEVRGAGKWPMVELGEICNIVRGASPRPIQKYITTDDNGENWIKIGDTKNTTKYIVQTSEKITPEGAKASRKVNIGDFILSNSMSFGRPYILKIDGYIHDGWLKLSPDNTLINNDYLYYILSSDGIYSQFERAATGGVVRNLNSELVRNVKLPLPPLHIQQQIVTELDRYQAIIDGARKVVENWRPEIRIEHTWPKKRLGDICEFTQGVQIPKDEQTNQYKEGYKRYLYIQDFKGENKSIFVEDKYPNKEVTNVDLVMANTGTPGHAFLGVPGILSNNLFKITFQSNIVNQKFLFYSLIDDSFQKKLQSQMKGGIQKHLGHVTIARQEIHLPPLDIQQQIIVDIEKESELVLRANILSGVYQQKIKDKINEVWNQK